MSGNSIEFGEEKLCQKMCSVHMLIWSAGGLDQLFVTSKG